MKLNPIKSIAIVSFSDRPPIISCVFESKRIIIVYFSPLEDLVRVCNHPLDDDVVELHLGEDGLWPPRGGLAVHQVGAEHGGQVLRVHLWTKSKI
jgi:hypothetical protein